MSADLEMLERAAHLAGIQKDHDRRDAGKADHDGQRSPDRDRHSSGARVSAPVAVGLVTVSDDGTVALVSRVPRDH